MYPAVRQNSYVTVDEHEVLQRFGDRLRELRKAAGYSQEGFAVACGIDRSYMGQIERAEVNITLRNQFRVARQLGLTISELLDGVG